MLSARSPIKGHLVYKRLSDIIRGTNPQAINCQVADRYSTTPAFYGLEQLA